MYRHEVKYVMSKFLRVSRVSSSYCTCTIDEGKAFSKTFDLCRLCSVKVFQLDSYSNISMAMLDRDRADHA